MQQYQSLLLLLKNYNKSLRTMHGPKLQYSNTDLQHLLGFGVGVHTISVTESQFKIHILWHFGLVLPSTLIFSLIRNELWNQRWEILFRKHGDSKCLSVVISVTMSNLDVMTLILQLGRWRLREQKIKKVRDKTSTKSQMPLLVLFLFFLPM